ncbi:MAG: 5-methylcytosine restriction system specificity protein McrC [Bacteroidales bacterium]
MLRQSGLLTVESAPEADLHLRQSPLVDVYLNAFLAEVEHLAHAGLAKRYRLTEGNLYKLKGRIQFAQQF